MTEIQKNEIFSIIDRLVAVPYCCPELKDSANAWKAAACTEAEKVAAVALIQELKEDVMDVDHTIEFFKSPNAAKYFGPEIAAQKLEGLLQHKANGGKYCNCDACACGAELLEREAILLG